MENLDIIILTLIVVILYVGFAITLFVVQKTQQNVNDK